MSRSEIKCKWCGEQTFFSLAQNTCPLCGNSFICDNCGELAEVVDKSESYGFCRECYNTHLIETTDNPLVDALTAWLVEWHDYGFSEEVTADEVKAEALKSWGNKNECG